MIKLTAPDGTEVSVNKTAVSSVYPNDGTFHHDAKTVLVVGGQHQAVKETPDEVNQLLG